MYKVFRILETIAKFFKKPLIGSERRIAMSPFLKDVFLQDDEKNLNRQREYYDPHKQFIRQHEYQMFLKKSQHQQYIRQDQGLAGLVFHKEQSLEQQILQSGDYRVQDNQNFIHSLQFNRQGANNYYFSIDDLESIQSFDDRAADFDMEDSIIFQA